jgi:hypothetical protein
MKGSIPCLLLLLTFLNVKIYESRSTKITTWKVGPKHKVVPEQRYLPLNARSGDTVYVSAQFLGDGLHNVYLGRLCLYEIYVCY